MNLIRVVGVLAVLALGIAIFQWPSRPSPIPVGVTQLDDGQWSLSREGQPYRIQGAGGEGSLEFLAASGGNSTRTWGVDAGTMARLDDAHRNGLTVAVGIWLEQSQKGFDYSDPQATAAQTETVLKAIEQYKNHPAVLVWGLGNEIEGYETGDDPALWKYIESLAKAVKELDPNHPTMTVVAEITPAKLAAIEAHCPSLDIVGVNSYGGCPTLPTRYQEAGGKKPFIVTEFGPRGPWEVARNDIDAVVEPASGEKAAEYRESYQATSREAKLCLGSYAFLWGHKQEATATWFGMMLPDGRKTAAVDTMILEWTGKPAKDLVPEIQEFEIIGSHDVGPGDQVEVRLLSSDPEGASLKASWLLMREADQYVTGGDFQQRPPEFPKAVVQKDLSGCIVEMPPAPGLYRLYVEVSDGTGAATANLPIRVTADTAMEVDPPVSLPYLVYADASAEIDFIPSGWMGNHAAMSVALDCRDQPQSGDTCIKCEYREPSGWGGVAWQNPEGDWGLQPGGKNFTGATRLSFWARGAAGGEKLKIGLGLLGREKQFFDTTKHEQEIQLTEEWQQFTVSLEGADLRRIKTPFFWVVASSGTPMTFFFDDIRLE